jgi:galactokinase
LIDPARAFVSLYGATPTAVASAPGRVNLIGEHTDYNGGFVLPVAIPQRTWVAIGVRDGHRVRAASAGLAAVTSEYTLGAEARGRGWLDYVQAVTQELARDGVAVPGFDLHVQSDVPVGNGLSSSAALIIALLRALRTALGLAHDDLALALLGQRAENGLVGAPVGVMDPLASSLASTDAALFVDVRDLSVRRIPLPAGAELLVIASGIVHEHATGDYRVRRAECERAASLLGVGQLRDLDTADLDRALALPEPLGRRVRHVVTENARVLAAAEALASGDVAAIGALFAASHRSMRDDYEVSLPDIDALVAIADGEPMVYGARLTGGGFGGSIVALCQPATAARVGRDVVTTYGERTGRRARVLVPSTDAAP